MVCIFDRLRGLLKTKFFSNINSKLRKGSRRLPFDFIIFHFFSRRNPPLPYGCTATKRIFDDSAHFYLFRNAKKVQTEKVKGKCFYLIKTSMKAKTFTDIN